MSDEAQTDQERERDTSPVELLWDLVFVFAVTQVTTLLARDPSWGRLGQAMLALTLIWWAWSAFVWVSNALDADSAALRGYLLAATVLIFMVGLTLPHAFGHEAGVFAGAYVLVRALHLGLYLDAARHGHAGRSGIWGFAVTAMIGMALLIAGASVGGWARPALWTTAAVIDLGGPIWLGRSRIRSLQQVAVAHFAERYGDFVILGLGESILSVGVGVSETEHTLSAGLIATATLGLIIALGMWWTYFDNLASAARERVRSHPDPVVVAMDSYSYLHLVIVAGIIIFAAGIKIVVHDSLTAPMPTSGRLAFTGGVATYLIGLVAFQRRMLGNLDPGRVFAAAALIALALLGGDAPAWTIATMTTVLVIGLCLSEWFRDQQGDEIAAELDTASTY